MNKPYSWRSVPGSSPSSATQPALGPWVFAPVKIGGGGSVNTLQIHFNPGFDVSGNYTSANASSDGTALAGCDTHGLYLGNAALGTVWQQVFLNSNVPVTGYGGFSTAGDFAAGFGSGVFGVAGAAIAPSNSSVMLAFINGYVMLSTNKGGSWVDTGIPRDTSNSGLSGNQEFAKCGQRMAFDPRNANIAVVGSFGGQAYRLTNLLSSPTHTVISTVPIGLAVGPNSPGIDGICFDPGSGPSSGNTPNVYCFSNGNGAYFSSDGGQTFAATPTTNMPLSCNHAAVIPNAGYYVQGSATNTDVGANGSNLYQYTGGASGTWSAQSTTCGGLGFMLGFAINPFDTNKFAVATGFVELSATDGGFNGTWSGGIALNAVLSPTVPWLTGVGGELPGSNVSLVFDPTHSGRLWLTHGTGICYTDDVSGAGSFPNTNWTHQTAGIEQMQAIGLSSPAGLPPVVAVLDQDGFTVDEHNANYPSSKFNVRVFVAGGTSDYAKVIDPSDHTTVTAALIRTVSGWGNLDNAPHHTKSTDGVTFADFSVQPNLGGFQGGGTIAMRTTLNYCTNGAKGFSPSAPTPQYTADGGATWNNTTPYTNAVAATGSSYNVNSGLVTLNMSSSISFSTGATANISGLTGTGADLSLADVTQDFVNISGSTVTYTLPAQSYTVSSGSYNAGTGVVTLNLSGFPANAVTAGTVSVSGLTGSGANLGSADGTFTANITSGGVVTYTIATGLTITSITGGTLSTSSGRTITSITGGTLSILLGASYADAFNFYLVSGQIGTWKSADGNNWTNQSAASAIFIATVGTYPQAITPGQNGHLFFANGPRNFPPHPNYDGLNRSTNGGATWSAVPNVNMTYNIGFGAIDTAAGATYPTCYMQGWILQSGTYSSTIPSLPTTVSFAQATPVPVGAQCCLDNGAFGAHVYGTVLSYSSGTVTLQLNFASSAPGSASSWALSIYGIWRSTDDLATWQWLTDFPYGMLDSLTGLVGDGSNPNKVWINYEGASMAIGYRQGAL